MNPARRRRRLSAQYAPNDDGTWRLESDFSWCCRSGADPARAELLADEGWLASTGLVGATGEVEYLLVADDGELLAAVTVVDADGTTAFWPADLPAEARGALYGARRDPEIFDTEAWIRMVPVG